MINLFEWLNNQLLKMEWLDQLIRLIVEKGFGFDTNEKIGNSIHFFLYDTIKIFILLSVLIFSISYIQSYFPPERTKKILGRIKGIKGNILGALFGTITPFCSCSSIPLFIGFTSAGLPLGVTFSFLISSPLVDLASFLILMTFFGWKIATIYVVVGLILAVIGGTIIDKLNLEKYVEGYILELRDTEAELDDTVEVEDFSMTRKERIRYSTDQVQSTVKKVWLYILIGVAIGAAIHNWIPKEFVQSVLGNDNPFSVIIAALFGIPMYADIFGTISIARVLFEKGVGIGTILTFMMGVTALSFPSLVMLSKVVKLKLLVIFISIVTVGIIIIGYLFNAIQFLFV
jgi:uncharacterized protein